MIVIKNEKEISIMRRAGRKLAQAMKELEKTVRPGITTEYLNRLAESLLLKQGGQCSFKNYQGFPACLCVSLNEEIVHGLPSKRFLREGDIVSLDLGFFYHGFHSDMAVTLPVGRVDKLSLDMIQATKQALEKGIETVKPGRTIGDISYAIQNFVERRGFSVVRNLCGHGIGKDLHEEPEIANYGRQDSGPAIKPGMTLCLEPMISSGSPEITKTKDGFTFRTIDRSLSCHFEHTIAVNKNGCRVLTE